MTEDQQVSIAVKLATIEQILNMNSSCIRRLEIRLLGDNADPDSGIIAQQARRIRKLEEDRIRVLAYGAAAMLAFRLLEKPIMKVFGL